VRDVIFACYRPSLGRYVKVIERLHTGSAIHAENTNIQIVECLFKKNKATGGAIYISDNSKLTIIKSSFLRNYDSSAIYANDTSLLIANSHFIQNTGRDGGAVRWRTYGGTVTIIGSNFTGNEALYNGGALFWVSTDTLHVTITNCTFVNNVVYTGGGGALQLTSINTNTTIGGNLFSSNVGSNRVSGGAIYISRQFKPSDHNHELVNNHASQKGGVLRFLKGTYVHKFTDIILNYNVFI
jgi:hypothetical protein